MFNSPPALPRLTSPCVIPLSALCFRLVLITPPPHHSGVWNWLRPDIQPRHEAILGPFSQHSTFCNLSCPQKLLSALSSWRGKFWVTSEEKSLEEGCKGLQELCVHHSYLLQSFFLSFANGEDADVVLLCWSTNLPETEISQQLSPEFPSCAMKTAFVVLSKTSSVIWLMAVKLRCSCSPRDELKMVKTEHFQSGLWSIRVTAAF